MANKGKKFSMDDRQDFQDKEKYPSTNTDLPADRFQDKVQKATAPETKTNVDLIKGNVAPNQAGTTASAAESVKKKMSIRPSSDASLADGKQVGGVPLGETLSVRGAAGVSRANVAVDESKSPYTAGGYRPVQRYDKKNSVDNFVINNVICEQIRPSFEESKDLRENPDGLSGYNGIKQFTSARGKKNAGIAPSSLLFDRSIDFIGKSSVIHTTGQVINTITPKSDYPLRTRFSTENDPITLNHPMHKANYLLKTFKFTIHRNGLIENPHFVEDKFIVDGQDRAIEASNFNWQLDANNVAQTIVRLQTELGRETTDKWSPLGYVIDDPYEYNMLMHDIEATTGALVGISYKSATASLAFNINKMGKDGAKGISPMVEMFNGAFRDDVTSAYYANKGLNDIFSLDAYTHGSAAAMIDAFDTINKYTTKADFFNQQRSLKFHLQNVDNNLNPLHCKKEFFKAVDSEYVFSTEDGNYNPMLPIYYTDKLMVMNPLSLNYFLTGWVDPMDQNFDASANDLDTGIMYFYSYAYADVRNNYSWPITHPFVAGLMRWMIRHRSNLAKAYFRFANKEVDSLDIELPIDYGMKSPNMFNFMVCSAAQDILWCRNVVFRDILFAGEQSEYIWKDLASMKDVNPLYASQFSYVDYGSALKLGCMRNDTKIRTFWPEKIEFRLGPVETSGIDHLTNKYLLPWYFNENALDATFDQNVGWFGSNTPNVLSLPSIRQGLNHDMVDLLYSVDEDALRLCLDKMTDLPAFTVKDLHNGNIDHRNMDATGTIEEDSHSYTALCGKGLNEYDIVDSFNTVKLSAIRFDAVSDGRVALTCAWDDAPSDFRGLKQETYYCTPRELGYIFPLIPKYARECYKGDESLIEISNEDDAFIDGSSVSKMIMYCAPGEDLNARSIDRTAALQQNWVAVYAYRDPKVVASNWDVNARTSIIPSINAFVDGALSIPVGGATLDPELTVLPNEYVLGGKNAESETGENRVVSLSRFMFTILQRYFTPISLFDDAYDANNSGSGAAIPSATPNVDPLEGAFYFGVAGCLGSDYNQSVLERLNIKDELNMYYVDDEFIKRSLIFRA